MHLLNDVVTLIPTANDVALQQGTTSPTSVTSPAVACVPPGTFGGYTYGTVPAANMSYLQASLGGMMLLPGSLNGYNVGCIGTNSLTVPTNGYNLYSVPTSTVSGITAGAGVQTSCCQPTTQPTSPVSSAAKLVSLANAYGVPHTTSTSSDSSSPSGGASPAPLSPAQTMELVWHGEFNRLFAQYLPHVWCLEPTFAPPSDRWRTFKDSAKVRFSCQDCGHGWTSMKGRVVFWFELNFATNTGCVMFKLYGQQCQRCKTGKFEHAMWYPEEVVKVIGNVYNRVGQIYYGFVRPPLRIDRRSGKPRNQHNADLCQACKEGLCKEEWTFS